MIVLALPPQAIRHHYSKSTYPCGTIRHTSHSVPVGLKTAASIPVCWLAMVAYFTVSFVRTAMNDMVVRLAYLAACTPVKKLNRVLADKD